MVDMTVVSIPILGLLSPHVYESEISYRHPVSLCSVFFSLYHRVLFNKGFLFLPEWYTQADIEWENLHSDLQAAWLPDAPLFDFDTIIKPDVVEIPLDLDLKAFSKN